MMTLYLKRINISLLEKGVYDWLKKTEGSALAEKFKAWLFQHRRLPGLTWLLMIYEAPMSEQTNTSTGSSVLR